MGNDNNTIRNGTDKVPADARTSLGNFSKYDSFGKAFNAAHSSGGSGHTFSYNDKVFTTDCKDNGDYRKQSDDRGYNRHKFNGFLHGVNGNFKDYTGIHVQDDILFRGYRWTSELDYQRKNYHYAEIKKQQKK